VLKEDASLEVFRDHKDAASMLLRVDLRECGSVKSEDQPIHGQQYVFEISLPGNSLEIACANQSEREEWVNLFAKTILESAEAVENNIHTDVADNDERTVEPVSFAVCSSSAEHRATQLAKYYIAFCFLFFFYFLAAGLCKGHQDWILGEARRVEQGLCVLLA
jgi:hypothetical protein